MRSRFSAYALGNVPYLLATWADATRPATLDLDPDVRWTRLDILDTEAGGPFESSGIVEFAAHWRSVDDRGVQHERSTFARTDRWRYVDGT